MADCPHANTSAHTKFCPDCGAPVNIVPREPGELQAMLNRVPQMSKNNPPRDTNAAMVRLITLLVVTATLQWALGKTSTEQFESIFTHQTQEAS